MRERPERRRRMAAGLGLAAALAFAACATPRRLAVARRSGPSSLDLARVEQRLADPTDPSDAAALARARDLLGPLAVRGHELDDWARPLLAEYVPRGRYLPGRIYVDVGLPRPVEVVPGVQVAAPSDRLTGVQGAEPSGRRRPPVPVLPPTVLVDLGAPTWHGSVDRLWTSLLSALYAATLPPTPASLAKPPANERSLVDHIQQRLLTDGMPTYVASVTGRAEAAAPAAPLGDRAAVAACFAAIGAAVTPLPGAPRRSPADRWRQLLAEDGRSHVFAVAGAAMAAALEQQRGQVALVQAVADGPAEFDAAYRALRPGALLTYELPPSAVVAH